MILRELESLPGFITSGNNHNELCYTDDTADGRFIKDYWKKSLDKLVEECKQKGVTINCKKIGCMSVSKRGNPNFELHIGVVKIK